MNKSVFKFRKNDEIGAASAEHDTEFLQMCFVDTGDIAQLKDVSDRRQIVLGRTGSGKSALLQTLALENEQRAISISPENLALTYVSNSTILKFFSDIGVNLDPFFKLLWRHVLIVEILTRHLERENGTRKSLLEKLGDMFAGTSRQEKEMREAIQYLDTWGKTFWIETEFRVKEITQKLESQLDAEANATLGIPGATLASRGRASASLSQDQKAELCSRAQRVVSAVQIQDLHKIVKLLDTVLQDRQKQYYILIDGLDENWVEQRLRYKLIMALILTACDFIQVKNAKIIVALRRDLIERVFRLTRDSGFQEEKYQSLYLPLRWTPKELIQVLDRRVHALVSRRYTKQKVRHNDLLPSEYDRIPITSYITQITTTPRDIIAFFNSCIACATDQSKLTANNFKDAVGEYSRSRLRALAGEWSADYAALLDFAEILQKRPESFKLSAITDREVEDLCLDICAENPGGECILSQHAMQVVDCVTTPSAFKTFLVQVFYKIGLVGLKLQPDEPPSWVEETGRSVSSAEITDDVSIVVHRKYHRTLGIRSS